MSATYAAEDRADGGWAEEYAPTASAEVRRVRVASSAEVLCAALLDIAFTPTGDEWNAAEPASGAGEWQRTPAVPERTREDALACITKLVRRARVALEACREWPPH